MILVGRRHCVRRWRERMQDLVLACTERARHYITGHCRLARNVPLCEDFSGFAIDDEPSLCSQLPGIGLNLEAVISPKPAAAMDHDDGLGERPTIARCTSPSNLDRLGGVDHFVPSVSIPCDTETWRRVPPTVIAPSASPSFAS